MPPTKITNFSPGRILLASFIFVISVGAFLLSLPQARLVNISILDIFFTSASATCVTGLIVVPISYFSFFGKCIILSLIQIGGLGLITLSFFFISLFLNLGMATKLMAGQILDFHFWGKIKGFLILIIGITFSIELIGTICLYFPFRETLPADKAIFYAVFHSISAFCNAGICLYDNNMINFINYPFTLMTLSVLVFAGGIGFIVWYEIASYIRTLIRPLNKEKKIYAFSLHTKLVLSVSTALIIFGTIFIWCIEKYNIFQKTNLITSITNSIFMSSTIRCAGFFTFKIGEASLATILIFLILMFIGASPNSAGSGIKTTTFILFIATVISIAKGRDVIEISGRTIPIDQIYKGITIIALASTWIIGTTFMLLLTDQKFSFIQILFETISAFSTTGLSTGITPYMSFYGKILLIITMIVGRIGSLTLILALQKHKTTHLYRYPEERILIG